MRARASVSVSHVDRKDISGDCSSRCEFRIGRDQLFASLARTSIIVVEETDAGRTQVLRAVRFREHVEETARSRERVGLFGSCLAV